MNVLLLLAHPERRSFNGAMFDIAADTLRAAGHEVATSDLYRMGFDPVSSRRNFVSIKNADYLKLQVEEMHASEVGGFAIEVETEMAKIEAADLMIWQFPLWWFGLPAILKGWVDRVFAMGRTYGSGSGLPAKAATSTTPIACGTGRPCRAGPRPQPRQAER
jgi:NAD(P)H dehydrogenase (quinone)